MKLTVNYEHHLIVILVLAHQLLTDLPKQQNILVIREIIVRGEGR